MRERVQEGSIALLFLYCRKHFPGREIDVDCMAEAAFLEWDYWHRMQNVLTTAIVKAFNG